MARVALLRAVAPATCDVPEGGPWLLRAWDSCSLGTKGLGTPPPRVLSRGDGACTGPDAVVRGTDELDGAGAVAARGVVDVEACWAGRAVVADRFALTEGPESSASRDTPGGSTATRRFVRAM